MDNPDSWQTIVRLLVALLCGSAVGWEREWRHKPAGLRTNMLVALGAAAFTLLSLRLAYAGALAVQGHIDPTRVLQGIIGGIGFLGAGAIIRAGGSVHGLTTAATIWVVGAAGIACGLGAYDIAIISTLLCFLVLTLAGVLERRLMHPAESGRDVDDPRHRIRRPDDWQGDAPEKPDADPPAPGRQPDA